MTWSRSPRYKVRTRYRARARHGVKIHIYELAEGVDAEKLFEKATPWRRYTLCRNIRGVVYAGEPLVWKNLAERGHVYEHSDYDVDRCMDCERVAKRHPAEKGVLV